MTSTNSSTTGPRRIHFVGASGSGTSTLGQAVAELLGYTFFDTDAFYWLPSDPPYQHARHRDERLAMLRVNLHASPRWVLSGSLCGWGDALIPMFDLVVFLFLPQELRLARLGRRELGRYGATRLGEGGDLHEHHSAFMAWAAQYDSGGLDIRSQRRHDDWLARLPTQCRVVRLNSERPLADLVNDVVNV